MLTLLGEIEPSAASNRWTILVGVLLTSAIPLMIKDHLFHVGDLTIDSLKYLLDINLRVLESTKHRQDRFGCEC